MNTGNAERPLCHCGHVCACLSVEVISPYVGRNFFACPNRLCSFFCFTAPDTVPDVSSSTTSQPVHYMATTTTAHPMAIDAVIPPPSVEECPTCSCGRLTMKTRTPSGDTVFVCALGDSKCSFRRSFSSEHAAGLPKRLLPPEMATTTTSASSFPRTNEYDHYPSKAEASSSMTEKHEEKKTLKAPTPAPVPVPPPVDIREKLPGAMSKSMMQFQIEGVEYAVKKDGRVLIGDEMGLGKTLQALAVATIYRKDWPVLIITPSSIKLSWKDEMLRWIPSEWIRSEQIEVILKGKDKPHQSVTIISYDLVHRLREVLTERRYGVVIADEAHYLKNRQTNRAKACLPLLKAAKRAILLTGTPALNRPEELFTLLHALHPKEWGRFWVFARRYCDAKQGVFGMDTSGASNLPELHKILKSTVMIRRLKKDVLTQLPPKRRQVIRIEVAGTEESRIGRIMKDVEDIGVKIRMSSGQSRRPRGRDSHNHSRDQTPSDDGKLMYGQQKSLLTQLFLETGRAKIKSVVQYVDDLLQSNVKFIIFAHHICVLDAIESKVKSSDVSYIRIDGKTPVKSRHDLVARFQSSDQVRVAVLSLTAAGQGLTLHASSNVVFAELYWVPGVLVQAEDRAHRIGQKDSVNIHYLVAKKTGDDIIWPTLKSKLAVIGESLDGAKAKFDAETLDSVSSLKAKKAYERQRAAFEQLFKPVLGMDVDEGVREQSKNTYKELIGAKGKGKGKDRDRDSTVVSSGSAKGTVTLDQMFAKIRQEKTAASASAPAPASAIVIEDSGSDWGSAMDLSEVEGEVGGEGGVEKDKPPLPQVDLFHAHPVVPTRPQPATATATSVAVTSDSDSDSGDSILLEFKSAIRKKAKTRPRKKRKVVSDSDSDSESYSVNISDSDFADFTTTTTAHPKPPKPRAKRQNHTRTKKTKKKNNGLKAFDVSEDVDMDIEDVNPVDQIAQIESDAEFALRLQRELDAADASV